MLTAIPAGESRYQNAPTADLKSVMCTLKNVIFAATVFALPAITPT